MALAIQTAARPDFLALDSLALMVEDTNVIFFRFTRGEAITGSSPSPLSIRAGRFIRSFDNHRKPRRLMRPFRFWLDIPEQFLKQSGGISDV